MNKIIIVEDNAAIHDAFRLIFSPEEYDLTIYLDARAVLTNNFSIPDIFILDKQLSGVDGLDVCKYLKGDAATQHVPVIILSASPNIQMLAKKAGADEVIEKPFRIKHLREVVRRLL